MTTVTIPISNIDCAACVERLERVLEMLPGVVASEASFTRGNVAVSYDEGRCTQADLVRCIRKAGFRIPAEGDAEESGALARQTRLLRYLLAAVGLTLPLLWRLPDWMQLVFGTLAALGPGRYFARSAFQALRSRRVNWDFPTVLVSLLLYGCGVFGGRAWFLGNGALLSLLLLWRYAKAVALYRADAPVRRLLQLQPKTALVERNGEEKELMIDEIELGDVIRIQPGDRIPADGILLDGICDVDESLLTQNSAPVKKHPGDCLTGGTLNRAGNGRLSVTAAGKDSVLSRMAAQAGGRHTDEKRNL